MGDLQAAALADQERREKQRRAAELLTPAASNDAGALALRPEQLRAAAKQRADEHARDVTRRWEADRDARRAGYSHPTTVPPEAQDEPRIAQADLVTLRHVVATLRRDVRRLWKEVQRQGHLLATLRAHAAVEKRASTAAAKVRERRRVVAGDAKARGKR